MEIIDTDESVPGTKTDFLKLSDDIYAMLDALTREGFRRLDMAFFGYDEDADPPPAIEH